MQQLAKESGWDCFSGSPLASPTGGIWGVPQGGVGLLCRRGWVCGKVDASDDPLWHSGRWLHVIACLGEGKEHINVQVVYGIAGNPTLNRKFRETVICYSSGPGNRLHCPHGRQFQF